MTDMLIKGPQRVFTIVDNLLQSHLLIAKFFLLSEMWIERLRSRVCVQFSR